MTEKTINLTTRVNLDNEVDFEDPLQLFTYALKASETKRQYPRRLKVYMDFAGLEGDIAIQSKSLKHKITEDKGWFKVSLIRFFEYQKLRASKNDISYSTISNYYKAIKLFVEMNFDSPVINWKKISKGIPPGRKSANDRAPTMEELKKLVKYPDRRLFPIVALMISSGIRIGSFDTMRWKDVIPIIENDVIVAAKLIVYPGDNEEYFTFMTPEAFKSLKAWMDYRKDQGEDINGYSWIMRDLWQTTEMRYGAKFGLASKPKHLQSSGVKSLLERALRAQGLVRRLDKDKQERRREWKGAHGFRKFYQTSAEKVMKSINVELTMGHDIGVSASYYRPNEREVLDDYLKAVEYLTLEQDRSNLINKIKNLEIQNKNDEYLIKGKLLERDMEIEALRQDAIRKDEAIAAISDKLQGVIEKLKEVHF